MKVPILTVALLISLMGSMAVQAETIYLSVAASMTDAFKEIITEFSTKHPADKILPNFASSGSLAKQINQGAPADIYVSANPKWMKFLVEKKMIAANTDHVFAYNTLVFVGREETKIKELAEVKNLNRIAIGSPQSVPAGQYAKQAMKAATLYSSLEKNRKLVMAKDVRQALLYADRGEVDGAFVYKTDAMLANHAKILFAVPEKLYNRVAYPLALTQLGAGKQTAKNFYNFMNTPRAITILDKYGFVPVD